MELEKSDPNKHNRIATYVRTGFKAEELGENAARKMKCIYSNYGDSKTDDLTNRDDPHFQ